MIVIVILSFIGWMFIELIKPQSNQVEPTQIEQTSSDVDNTIEESNDSVILDYQKRPVKLTGNRWRADQHGLPYKGIVVGGEQTTDNPNDNWTSVRDENGTINIIRDIDPDLWKAILIGDIIE
jgi:hypothetical protein